MANDNLLNKDEITQRLETIKAKGESFEDFNQHLKATIQASAKYSAILSNPHYYERLKNAPEVTQSIVNLSRELTEFASTFLHSNRGPRP
jgi:hypothetical protein